jgi:signal transduction histidine kinase
MSIERAGGESMEGDRLDNSLDAVRLEIEQLHASRARVALAADAERRRIERDLHDGAQQHLVALAVNVQLARQLVDIDRDAARTLLEEIGHDVRAALESVRELAQRIYPPLLIDRGLVEALRAAASACAAGVRVEAAALDRYAPEVESAVYFCCVETFGDGGAPATVRVWHDDGALRFDVTHDSTVPEPVELTAMRDRLGALGGRLTVTPEGVSGTIPVSP